jgi:isoquinoline 1-oxidoreductase beta subunit
MGYGALAAAAAALPVPQDPPLKQPAQRRLLGTRPQRVDSRVKVTGRAEFGLDVRRPGMLTAVVVRCPVFGGKMASFDGARAAQVKGVRRVMPIGSGVAVVADHFWAARKGAEALSVQWDEGPNAGASSEGLTRAAAELAKKPGKVAARSGDADKALAGAKRRIQAIYEAPYQAHAPMEPASCTVEIAKDGCDVWVPHQAQGWVQEIAAKVTGLDPASVRVHTTYLGGAFGRRAERDFVIEAATLAKAMGAPVKVVWSREDDLRHDYYRPASYNVLRGGVAADGAPVGWSHRIVSPSIMTRMFPQFVKDGLDHSSVEGADDLPYDIPNLLVDYHLHDTGIPVGFWRSVGHSQNAFVIECFLDELAALAKQDPYEYRRKLCTKAPRLKAALELAAAKAGWGSPLAPATSGGRRGRGIAMHASFGSFVAQVAEVTVFADGEVRVDRVVCAVDCGSVVHPGLVEAQMEGAIVYGLTAAIRSEITIEKGRVKQGNFHNFKLLRIDEMPVVEVHIVPSGEKPGGVGEPGTPPIAPAVVNAIAAATGKRLRRLPVRAADLRG